MSTDAIPGVTMVRRAMRGVFPIMSRTVLVLTWAPDPRAAGGSRKDTPLRAIV
jgi:hypothetical protein